MKKFGWLVSLVICFFLGAVFGYVYFHNHAYGTWGDDSAGYIYLWGRLAQKKPLVYQEPLTVKALNYFGDEKLARWTTATHYEIISPKGYIASKYPIGLSLVFYVYNKVFKTDIAIYYVLPSLAVLSLILVYLIANLIFRDIKWKYLLSLGAASVVGLSTLYYEAAISQPMREIPSIFFMLIGYYCLLLAIRFKEKKYFFYLLLISSFLSLGFSVNIRETSLVILPAFLILFVCKERTCAFLTKRFLKISVISLVILIIGLLPTIINSVKISQFKEKFKKKDITSIAITSNFDHIRSFSLSNLFNNNGKFKPGEQGGLAHFWQIMKSMSSAPYFLLLVAIGFIYLFKKNKWLFISFIWWLFSFLAIFSLWINPYSRYILPLFPLLAILGMYGLYNLIVQVIPKFISNKKWQYMAGALIIISLLISYQPVIAQFKTNLQLPKEEMLVYKSISEYDLNKLKDIVNKIKTEKQNKKQLIVFSGTWQYGISETLESHTGMQSIRMPLEQKFVFKEEKIKEFFDQTILSDYQVYVWLDTTTKPETRAWLSENYSLQEKYKNNFTFEQETIIYELTTKN